MRPRRNTPRGFTLMELMVVVAIIAIIAVVIFNLNSTTYGASANTIADQITADLNMCKMRAVSTRRWHRCEITGPTAAAPATPNSVTVLQWQSTGMAVPAAGNWSTVFTDQLSNVATATPSVQVWDATTTPCVVNGCAGAPTSKNDTLVFDIDFRPDGSSTGGTLFITQPNRASSYRVVTYKATGSSYARNSW
ncbi:hypothetical protein BH11MYX1_BH11MYX1_07240 [soil metagenome]